MKLHLFLSLALTTITFIAFGMNRFPNTIRSQLPAPYPLALLPVVHNDQVQNENLKPVLQRLRTAFVTARAERRAYPAAGVAEITEIIATIP